MSDSIDQSVVEALKELGGEDDPELFNELVDVFLGDTPGRLETMTRAAQTGDAAGLAAAAHSLKSSSANMGALRLSGMCRALEEAGRQGDANQQEAVDAAKQEFEAVSRLLRDARN